MTHLPPHLVRCTWLGPVFNGYAWLLPENYYVFGCERPLRSPGSMICGPSWAYDPSSISPIGSALPAAGTPTIVLD